MFAPNRPSQPLGKALYSANDRPPRRWRQIVGRLPLSTVNRSTNMADPNPSNHWDSLASDLGVKLPEQEAAPPEPAPLASQPPPLPTPKPRAAPKASTPAPALASWDALASDLGLATAPQPIAPQPIVPTRSAAVSPPSASAPLPAAAKPDRRDAPAPRTAEESPNFFDERFDFEEPFDLLEPSEASPPTPVAETKESPEEKRPRKRHRQRRSGREPEREDSHEPAAVVAESPSPEAAPLTDEPAPVSTIVAAEGIGVEEVRTESDEAGERRPKRRRSSRGKKKRPSDGAKPAAAEEAHSDEPAVEAVGTRPATPRDDDSIRRDRSEPEEGIDEGDEDLGDGDRPARAGFRGIPTWEEAVGLVIAKNMEARLKRSAGGGRGGSGGSRQGRGGSGSHDKRGGRGGRRRP